MTEHHGGSGSTAIPRRRARAAAEDGRGRADVVGCVVAGGLSSRMGGGDKGLLPLAGRPLMARAVERLRRDTAAAVINANGDPARFSGFGLPVVADPIEGHAGPLAGVLAGMDFAAARHPQAAWLVTAAADTPFFPDDLVEALLMAAGPDARPVVAASAEGRHPTFCLWPTGCRDALRRFLADGETRRMGAFLDAAGATTVHFPPLRLGGRRVDPFFNVNTPADLAEAAAIAALRPDGPSPFAAPLVFGLAGWKNAGKTTLAARLIAELTRRGLRVASVKHAHYAADVDRPGSDSFRHREAGAVETALVSGARMAIMTEFGAPGDEPGLGEVLARLGPADLVLVEGYKRAPIPKIEVRRLAGAGGAPLHPGDQDVILIAADHAVEGATVPVLPLDDAAAVADALLERLHQIRDSQV